MSGATPRLPDGAVLVIGAGLMGTSVGLALRSHGALVHLMDTDAAAVAAASSRGAGSATEPAEVGLVVVAVPPRSLGAVVVRSLQRWTTAVVTDVGSVKMLPLRELLEADVDATRYVGGHPMAGSERSGAGAATGSLFAGRPWALTPHPMSSAAAMDAVRALVALCGGNVVELSAPDHDDAAALVSHLPHLMATLTAAQLASASEPQLALAGQGLRDVTRVAAGDPVLWGQILSANAGSLRQLIEGVRDNLNAGIAALEGGDIPALVALLEQGRRGVARIPPP